MHGTYLKGLIILPGVYRQKRNLARITAEVQREQAGRTARETRRNPLQASMKRQVRAALPKWSRRRPQNLMSLNK